MVKILLNTFIQFVHFKINNHMVPCNVKHISKFLKFSLVNVPITGFPAKFRLQNPGFYRVFKSDFSNFSRFYGGNSRVFQDISHKRFPKFLFKCRFFTDLKIC